MTHLRAASYTQWYTERGFFSGGRPAGRAGTAGMMSHEQLLLTRVGQVRTRIRLLLAQQGLCAGLAIAAAAGLLLVAATRLQWWRDAVDFLWLLLAAGGAAGLLFGWTRSVPPHVAAQVADDRAGLKERLSTAVEIAGRQERTDVATAQLADAARHAQALRPASVLPWRAPASWRWLAASGAVLAAALFLPDLPLFKSAQERMDREAMRTQGALIQKVAKNIERKAGEKKDDENAAILRRIARNMKQLGKDQERNRISKKQAMLQMNELQKQLREARQKFGGGDARKSLEKAAAELQQMAQRQQQRGSGENARALQQMSNNLKSKDFEGAKKQLEELAKKFQSGKMSPEEAKATAEMLQQMAASMDGSTLQQAGEQLKEASKALQQAAQKAQKLQQQMQQAKTPAERQQLQQQMQQAMSQGAQSAAQQSQQAGGT